MKSEENNDNSFFRIIHESSISEVLSAVSEDSERILPRDENITRPKSKAGISICKSNIKNLSRTFPLKSYFGSKKNDDFYVFTIVGASVDLVIKKMYPALWNLYNKDLLPSNIKFYAFTGRPSTVDKLREQCRLYVQVDQTNYDKYEEFWSLNNYFTGSYLSKWDYVMFNKELHQLNSQNHHMNRLFYIALPNSVLDSVLQNLKLTSRGLNTKGSTRVLIEKPFGRDIESCEKLSKSLLSLFKEEEIYRIDYYLGKEIIQNILAIRFCNFLFSSTWSRDFIKAILITYKDPNRVRSTGRRFDQYGIIRNCIQSHIIQILSMIAMEKPLSLKSDDIRDEKVKVFKCIPPVKLEDVVMGQYIGDRETSKTADRSFGYADELDTRKNSLTPTFCVAVLKIQNER